MSNQNKRTQSRESTYSLSRELVVTRQWHGDIEESHTIARNACGAGCGLYQVRFHLWHSRLGRRSPCIDSQIPTSQSVHTRCELKMSNCANIFNARVPLTRYSLWRRVDGSWSVFTNKYTRASVKYRPTIRSWIVNFCSVHLNRFIDCRPAWSSHVFSNTFKQFGHRRWSWLFDPVKLQTRAAATIPSSNKKWLAGIASHRSLIASKL